MATATKALVLQGGGALGAYQAGVFEALIESDSKLDWVGGISIGAINAALIAGNAPERRVERLRAFWELVSETLIGPAFALPGVARAWQNRGSAFAAMMLGVPGFFSPRMPPAAFQLPGSPGAISVYDTAPLRETL